MLMVPACFQHQDSRRGLLSILKIDKTSSFQIKRRLPDAIEVSDKEAEAFVCNAITIRKAVISPIGVSDQTKESLDKLGYKTVEVDMIEFMKSGGACQCLVMKL